MKLTKANITRVLKAAGFRKSEEIRSRQIRGHVRFSDGFRVEESTFYRAGFYVMHMAGLAAGREVRTKMNNRYAQALQGPFRVEVLEDRIVVWDRATDAPAILAPALPRPSEGESDA